MIKNNMPGLINLTDKDKRINCKIYINTLLDRRIINKDEHLDFSKLIKSGKNINDIFMIEKINNL